MSQFMAILTIFFSVLMHSQAYAARGYDFTDGLVQPKVNEQYMVSAVLRLDGTDATIPLVQSIERAETKEEAIGKASNRIRLEFIGYSVIDTIAQVIKKEPLRDCLYL